jgi:hypothetical protein
MNMANLFGYRFAASDNIGLNLFFVHESAAGSDELLTLDDAKRLFTGGRDGHGYLHALCSRYAWLRIPDDANYASTSFELNAQPLVLLSTMPGGSDNMQRIFYEVNAPAILRGRLERPPGKELTEAAARLLLARQVQHLPARTDSGRENIEVWMVTNHNVVALMLVSFVAGVVAHHARYAVRVGKLRRFSKV